MPSNAATGKAYRGGNILALWCAEIENAYGSSYWSTYKQWSALGRQVVRGQRATFGIKWVDRGSKDDGRQGRRDQSARPRTQGVSGRLRSLQLCADRTC